MKLLCLCCGTEVETAETLQACPSCGDSEHTPADLDGSLTIHISEHELRVLTIWASNWAGHLSEQYPDAQKAVRVILDRLGTQTDIPLSLSQELADLRATFPGATVITNVPDQ